MTWTCPAELTAALPTLHLERAIIVDRHVAYDVLSDLDSVCLLIGRPVTWMADMFVGNELQEQSFQGVDALNHVCIWADSVYGVDREGNRITPTLSLVS